MAEPTINLSSIAASLRKARFGILASIAIGACAGALWAVLSNPVYETVIVAAPVEADPQSAGALAGPLGLASLVGLNPSGQVTRKNEALATLRSRAFLNSFVTDLKLLPVLFGSEPGPTWRSVLGMTSREPTLEDAYEVLTQQVLSISDDRRTGLVEITVRWTDPVVAAQWGGELLARLNREMQSRALQRSAKEMAFLQKELDKTGSVEVRQAIFRLIETQLKTSMLANVSEEFALRVVDPPLASDPGKPVSLSLAARLLIGAIVGAFISIALVIARALPSAMRD